MDMAGVVLDERYRIIKKLGAGGMAEVFLADDLKQGKQVAVKIMPPSTVGESEFVRRFRREFDVCSSLDHPNIVKLYSCGRTPNGASWYYAMELLDCKDLEELLKEREKLKPTYVIQIVLQLARGFEHYHSKGVVHRDLKPSNIMIESNGRVVIMDFGLVHDPSMTQLTKTGTVMGTPQYMSPELLSGEKTDPRSDIFQLGSITHECLCGKPAFPGSTVPEVGAKIMFGRYVPIRQVDKSVSADWEVFLLNCLGTERTARYQSADVILKDLQKMMTGDSVKPLIAKDESVLDGATESTASASESKNKRRKRRSRSGSGNEGQGITDTDPQLFRSSAGRLGAKTAVERQGTLSSGRISSASFIDNPENVKKSRTAIMVTGAIIIMAVFCSIFYTLVLKTEYDSTNLAAIPGVGTIAVTWSSVEPYPSVVSISQGTNDSRVVNGESSESVKDHSIKISNLKLNVQYSVQVLYPDESRGPIKRLRTLEPKINIKTAKFSGKTLNITWTVTPPGKTRVWVKRSNKGASSVFDAIQSSGSEGVAIDDASELIDTVSFEVAWEDGSSHKISLNDAIADEVGLLCNRLEAFDVDKFQSGIEGQVGKRVGVALNQTIGVKGYSETEAEFKARRKRENQEAATTIKKLRDKARVEVGKLFLEIPTYDDYHRSIDLSPLVLGLSIIKPSLKYRFYEHVNNYVELYAYLFFNNTNVTEIKPLPHLGHFQSRIVGPSRASDEISSINLLPSVPGAKFIELGPTIPWGSKPNYFHTLDASFKVPDISKFTRAFIYMSVRRWDNCALIISINGRKPSIMAFNNPAISHTKKRDDNIKIGIPFEFLKDGANAIEFTQTTLFQSMGKQEVKLHGMFLHLYR